jgi:hypothetical protein
VILASVTLISVELKMVEPEVFRLVEMMEPELEVIQPVEMTEPVSQMFLMYLREFQQWSV